MFIEIGEFNIKLFILLIYPIGIILVKIIFLGRANPNPYFCLFCFFISHYLSLAIKLIYKIKNCFSNNKKIEENILNFENDVEKNKSNIKSIEFDIYKKGKNIKKRRRIRIIYLALLYFISYFFFYYANLIIETSFYGNIAMIMEIIYFSLFNKIILGNKIYTHHFFSMIIITICIIGLYILVIVKYIQDNEWEFWRDIFFPTFLNLIVYCIFCYDLVLGKLYIEKYFISIYELMIWLGTIGLILLIVFEPFTFLISCNNPSMCYDGHLAGILSGFKQLFDLKGIFLSIGLVFFLFMTAYGLWLTVIILSPSHFLTSDSIITFELNILIDCYNPNFVLLNNPWFYILSIINIFACLIYNEIIILKIFNLNYNTKKEILKRQNIENLQILRINTELSEEDDRKSHSTKRALSESLYDIE